MKREEIEKEVFKLVLIANDHQILPQITTNKIMLLIDEYTKLKEADKFVDDLENYAQTCSLVMQSSANMRALIERKKWTQEQIFQELQEFYESNYKGKKSNPDKIKQHFFNFIRKRKPQKDEQPTGDQAIRDFLNS